MANLGDVSRAATFARPKLVGNYAHATTWPNSSRAAPVLRRSEMAYPAGATSRVSRPMAHLNAHYSFIAFTRMPFDGVSNVVDIPTAKSVILSSRGNLVKIQASSAGHAYFYNLMDGTYLAVESDGAATWRVVVAGASVSVVEIVSGVTLQPMIGGRLLYIDGDKIKALPEASP